MKKVLLVFISILSFTSIASLNWSTEQLSDSLAYENYDEVKSLSEDEKWAVLAYGFTDEVDYQDMNGFRREGEKYNLFNHNPKSVQKLIDDVISSALKLPQIPKGLIVYRGFKLAWRDGKCFVKGEIIQDKAFTSTTLSKKIANHFAFNRGEGKGAFLKLEIKEKQHGILITENDEDEVLLMPSRKISVTKAEVKDDKCFVEGFIE